MEGTEAGHAVQENEEEEEEEIEKGGGSLVPDLWVTTHMTKFISDSKRTDVSLVNGCFVVVSSGCEDFAVAPTHKDDFS